MTGAEKLLRRLRLELARDPDFPAGSRERGYDFIAPLDESGRIVHKAWEELKDRCRVRRFWPGQADEVGHVVRRPSGQWSFHYDIHGDAARDESASAFRAMLSIQGNTSRYWSRTACCVRSLLHPFEKSIELAYLHLN